MSLPDVINCWLLTKPGNPRDGTPPEFERGTLPMPEIEEGWGVVQVAGCGVCHTDISFAYMGVPTVNGPPKGSPLVLGHEVSGTMVAGPEDLIGKQVIVPAVIPCHDCVACNRGRENLCVNMQMPGNSMGQYGGFADYMPVPVHDLCVIDDCNGIPLEHLAVVADAVTTPYQAAIQADVMPGDGVIVTGHAGGIGKHMVQICKALGANHVIGFDPSERRDEMKEFGLSHAIDSTMEGGFKAVKGAFKAYCKEHGLNPYWGWKIFECSGTAAGQSLAFGLLPKGGTLMIVGFTPDKVEVRLSNLMVFGAKVEGVWGCNPVHYPKALKRVLDGYVKISPLVQTHPVSQFLEALEEAHESPPWQRIVLTPDW
ncbi:6-hydroxycyclohex-1-ene-1-carbonyl-CoA dehydrogenase [Patescibacteria group bacterium]